jgi:hypothetical protein
MQNCAQFAGDVILPCKDHGYKHTNSIEFDALKFRSYIKKEYEFEGSPYMYMKNHNSSTKFALKPHQKFIGKYVNMHTNNNGVLMYASVGSGKSLTSIVAGICYIAYHTGQKLPKITVITPANLVDNYKKELTGLGPEQVFVNNHRHTYQGGNFKTTHTTKYFIGNKQNTFISSKLIKKHWDIVTHRAFINGLYNSRSKLPGKNIDILKEPGRLYIIDEVHNLVSENGDHYHKLLSAITNYMHPTSKLILMSATPIVDSTHEIGLTLNLLRPRIPFPETKKAFDKLNEDELKYMMYGYVSYFSGGDPNLYPRKTIEMVYHRFVENSVQYENYLKVYKKELPKKYTIDKSQIGTSNNSGFFVKSMIAANIFFNKTVKESMKQYSGLERFRFAEINVSVKYTNVCKRVLESNGTCIVFSPYLDMGVKALAIILESLGFKRYNHEGVQRKNNTPRYLIWSGQVKDKEAFADEILPIFNSDDNIDGKHIKVILATRAISEGITFKNVRHLHICNHFWNENIMKQIIGRCDRMNSHIALPPSQRKLHVYRHIMVLPSFGTFSLGSGSSSSSSSSSSSNSSSGLNLLKDLSIEEYVNLVANNKTEEHNKIQKIIQSSSVDCELNRHGNKSRTYIFKDHTGTYVKDNVTGETLSVYINGAKRDINVRDSSLVCKVTNLSPNNMKNLSTLITQSKNAKVCRGLLSSIMHSKMTNADVDTVNEIKLKLIKCAVHSFGPGGVPKSKQPSSIKIGRYIKEFLDSRKINRSVNTIYKQLISSNDTSLSDTDMILLEDIKEYLRIRVV